MKIGELRVRSSSAPCSWSRITHSSTCARQGQRVGGCGGDCRAVVVARKHIRTQLPTRPPACPPADSPTHQSPSHPPNHPPAHPPAPCSALPPPAAPPWLPPACPTPALRTAQAAAAAAPRAPAAERCQGASRPRRWPARVRWVVGRVGGRRLVGVPGRHKAWDEARGERSPRPPPPAHARLLCADLRQVVKKVGCGCVVGHPRLILLRAAWEGRGVGREGGGASVNRAAPAPTRTSTHSLAHTRSVCLGPASPPLRSPPPPPPETGPCCHQQTPAWGGA